MCKLYRLAFFHLAIFIHASSMAFCSLTTCSFSSQHNIHSMTYTACQSIHLLRYIWVASKFWQLRTKFPAELCVQVFMCIQVVGFLCSYLNKYLGGCAPGKAMFTGKKKKIRTRRIIKYSTWFTNVSGPTRAHCLNLGTIKPSANNLRPISRSGKWRQCCRLNEICMKAQNTVMFGT